MAMRVLVVDDEVQIVTVLRGYLEKAGFDVVSAYDGREALRMARSESPDLIVLDLMLPGLDGLDVCRTLRRESDVPIIMLTARVEETDTLIGLEIGADDYVTKPFSPREVVARVRAVLRRRAGSPTAMTPRNEAIDVGDLHLDVGRRLFRVGEHEVTLTQSEFEIMRAMMASPGRVYSREQLLDVTQGEAYPGYERSIDTHIKNLRRKLEPNSKKPQYIITVHRVGYKLAQP